MNDPAIRRVLAAFLLVSAIAVFVAIVSVRNITRAAASSDWVNHTHAVILEVEGILSTARAGEASLRAFAATGAGRDRTACREAYAEAAEHMEVAKALTRSEASQHGQILRLEKLTAARAAFADSVLAALRSWQPETARALLARDDGFAVTEEIRRAVAKLRDEEMALLAERDTASYVQAQATRWTVWSGVTLNFFLLAGAAWLIRDDLVARRRATAILQEANTQLETKVQERTAELRAANEQLSAENLERRWAHEALEHQIHYNQLIVDSIADSVFVLTKALNVSRINPAAVRLTGFEAPSLINRPIGSVVRLLDQSRGGHAPLVDPIVQALKEGHDLRDLPAEVTDKLGAKAPVYFTLFPLRDRDKVVGGVVILREAQPGGPPIV